MLYLILKNEKKKKYKNAVHSLHFVFSMHNNREGKRIKNL